MNAIDFWALFNPIKFLVLGTFGYGCFKLDTSRVNHVLLLCALGLAAVTEIVNSVLLFYGLSIITSTNISMALFFIPWILLFAGRNHVANGAGLLVYVAIAVYNLAWGYGLNRLIFSTFISGSILYIGLYIHSTWRDFKGENLDNFQANNFILKSSPIVFMAGISMMFAFRSRTLNHTEVISGICLYDIVVPIINVIIYGLILTYIYKEGRLNYA